VGKRLEIARALGSPGRLSSPIPIPRREEPIAAEPSLPTLGQALARHIEYAVSRTKGRIEGSKGAAARLAINPHTLRSRMRKLGIDWRSYRAKGSA
jgi:DNA-binding NtrC family response regulator